MKSHGFSLVEMLVSLVILSILASATIPYAKVEYTRTKELKLTRALRTIRSAIDAFNDDCKQGLMASAQEGVSRDCFPRDLQTLVDGVLSSDADGHRLYYLRRVPEDPFSDAVLNDQWEIRGYRDEPEGTWHADDLFDVRVQHDMRALNGSEYRTW